MHFYQLTEVFCYLANNNKGGPHPTEYYIRRAHFLLYYMYLYVVWLYYRPELGKQAVSVEANIH